MCCNKTAFFKTGASPVFFFMGEPQVCEKTYLLDASADPRVLLKESCLA